MTNIAKDYEMLAQDSKTIHGYVLTSIIRSAGTQAIGGRKTDRGYLYEFEDGSWANIDIKGNNITEAVNV